MNTIGKVRGKTVALVVGLMGGVAAGALFLSPMTTGTAFAEPIAVQAPKGAPMSFADLIERVSPAVVSVQVVTEIDAEEQFSDLFERFRGLPGFEDFLERRGIPDEGEEDGPAQREGRSLGSGFFISSTGHIVTNNHVVEDAAEVTVTLSDGRELEAEVIGTDPDTDLAVLKVREPGNYPHVEFSSQRSPRVGDWVVAVGNPFGLGGTATAGIVSADGRELGGSYNDFIQIDASINRGNSGGPTFDLYGNVIGVNTAIFSPSGGSVGIGFAIEAGAAQEIVDTLIRDGKVTRGWLGVSIRNVTDGDADAIDLDEPRGAFVADVSAGGPAEASGIEPSDVIMAINGNEIDSMRELTQQVGRLRAGSKNEFEVFREGKIRKIAVTIGVRPDDPNAAFDRDDVNADPDAPVSPEETGVGVMGLQVSPLTAEVGRALGLPADEQGLTVLKVRRGDAFEEAGIAAGDVILEAQRKPINSADGLRRVIQTAKDEGKEHILVAVRKGRTTVFRPVNISGLSD